MEITEQHFDPGATSLPCTLLSVFAVLPRNAFPDLLFGLFLKSSCGRGTHMLIQTAGSLLGTFSWQ